MALRMIVQDGDPILKKKCRPVTNFDDRLATLLDDMIETLDDAGGYGLAGPQVGVMRRIFITLDERDFPEDGTEEEQEAYVPGHLEFINPEILSREGEEAGREGCLSFPGVWAEVRRPEKVTVRAFDRTGKPFTVAVDGLLARCVCHESDHLDGVTLLDVADRILDEEEAENYENGE